MKLINKGICAVTGVKAYGIKEGKYGLAIIEGSGNAVGVFTKNKFIAAPLIVTQKHLESSNNKLNAIIINSGNANAFTGEQGFKDAENMAILLADKLKVKKESIGVASTGVIGRTLNMDWIKNNIDRVFNNLTNSSNGCESAARAIMTTDTKLKKIAIELENGVRIGGIAKGAGMIEPNMATMLAFIYTDANLQPNQLKKLLISAVDKSFNMTVVDGDTSTNDMVLLTATCKKGKVDSVASAEFQNGLDYVCIELAKMIASDGEGATKLIEAKVIGALSEDDAKKAAKAIVCSPLVKTAIFGEDPNWGRVIAAVGYSDAKVDENKISLSFSNKNTEIALVQNGKVLNVEKESNALLKEIMASKEIDIIVDIGIGSSSANAYGCDLTYDYVKINAKYTT